MPRLRKVNAHTSSDEMVKHLKEELQKLKAQYEAGGGDPDLHDEIKERFATWTTAVRKAFGDEVADNAQVPNLGRLEKRELALILGRVRSEPAHLS